MAPGAIAVDLLPIAEGSSRDAMTTPAEHKLDGDSSGIRTNNVGDSSKLYTGAYTHGYTDGYFSAYAQAKQSPIAIVGMSCRLPGNVTTPDEFWELCSRARSGWSEIPKERFEMASFYHPNPGKNGCFNAIGGNFLKEDIGLFDAPFFSLTAQEATSMDPQQRLLLECTFEALDSAGIPKHKIVGQSVGVFIGGSFSEYESQLFADTETIPMHQATGKPFHTNHHGVIDTNCIFQVVLFLCNLTEFPISSTCEVPALRWIPLVPQVWSLYIKPARVCVTASLILQSSVDAI